MSTSPCYSGVLLFLHPRLIVQILKRQRALPGILGVLTVGRHCVEVAETVVVEVETSITPTIIVQILLLPISILVLYRRQIFMVKVHRLLQANSRATVLSLREEMGTTTDRRHPKPATTTAKDRRPLMAALQGLPQYRRADTTIVHRKMGMDKTATIINLNRVVGIMEGGSLCN